MGLPTLNNVLLHMVYTSYKQISQGIEQAEDKNT